MTMLVSLDQASLHLKRDTNDDDADVLLKIEAASRAVLYYLGSAADFVDDIDTDSDGNVSGVPAEVQQATLLLLGNFKKDLEGGGDPFVDGLPESIKTLLRLAGRVPRLA